jgi:hypothetical protein
MDAVLKVNPLIKSQIIEGGGVVTTLNQKVKQTSTNQSPNKTTSDRESAIVQKPDSGRNGKGNLRNSPTEDQTATFTFGGGNGGAWQLPTQQAKKKTQRQRRQDGTGGLKDGGTADSGLAENRASPAVKGNTKAAKSGATHPSRHQCHGRWQL